MLNVLAFSHALSFGGAQISTIEFFEYMKNKDFSLRIVTCDNSTEFVSRLKSLGLKHRTVSCSTYLGLPMMSISSIDEWIKCADLAWLTDTEFLVAPRIKEIKDIPVVMHLHSYPLLCPWWGLLYGMRDVCYEGCSLRRIVRCKQLFNEELAELEIINSVTSKIYRVLDLAKGPVDYFKWRRVISREVLDSIDGFIAVSKFVKKMYKEFLPIGDKPIEVIYNPVTHPLKYVEKLNESGMGEYRDEDLVVYASGPNPVKGPHLLLQALKMLLDEGQNIKLLMFGCKDTWIEKYIARLGLERNVVCMGKESFDKLYEAMYKAEAVVMPSIWPEPFGRVPVESNRLGTPAVVTNRGGLPETISHGETGVLVNPSVEEIAKGIINVLDMKKGSEVIRKSLCILNPEESVNKLTMAFRRLI